MRGAGRILLLVFGWWVIISGVVMTGRILDGQSPGFGPTEAITLVLIVGLGTGALWWAHRLKRPPS